ncbi:lipopolysaccharide biosynthesis protein [Neobacillus sp. LXY-1]|uniref:lipopolysaccharide biosynthesis protein n=1 Tax=Neobacillus sp. LXY-1 TaxID=3379133 RepID=UPI003EE2FC84
MNIVNLKGRKFLFDIVINIFSSAISVLLLQFFVYPLIGRKINGNLFGEILTIMGIVNIISVVLGNSLNNIRLILNNDYEEKKISGDFLPILFFATIVNIISIFLLTHFNIIKESTSSIQLLIIVSILTMFRSYLIVSYRLDLNYKMIFNHSIFYCLGLIVGIYIYYYGYSEKWENVFICGELISILFLAFTTRLYIEPFKITSEFKKTFNKYISLAFSNFIGNVLIYLDRLMILPLLGGKQVTVYYAASLVGKMSSFVLQPISGVLLTYFSKSRKRMKVKEFIFINLIVMFFSFIAFLGCIFLSKYILKILYPSIYDNVLNILVLASLAAILNASSSITQSIILRYSSTYWQSVIQAIYGLIYIGGGLFLIEKNGLVGFCVAATVAAVIKIVLIIIIGLNSLRDGSYKARPLEN